MNMRMLIDARHREETRVAIVKGNRIEEFDFESAEHKQLKGNIYLAKVTRVEPSLQAAFVDYGGNRHGFLAFSEIHPDYYQIPKEDREALLAEEARHAAEEAALREDEDADEAYESAEDDVVLDDPADDEGSEASEASGEETEAPRRQNQRRGRGRGGNDEGTDESRRERMALRRRYKIQDVIRRRQVLLVQVVKEERGNKGAALTTYLSLAGRYCVLMPNTSHGGGISRKISNVADRKRLKSIIAEMALPPSMGCIVRTAGLQRTSPEIRRDFDYLARLWDEIREKTLKSDAPALIHNDSDLIKRAIRDIYNRDIDEVLVEGEYGYRAAKDFMKLLMPSHARKVQQYSDAVSLFQRHGVEDQLAAMYHPVVQLKSGGYLVINPTEALVSIDINSGRSTREHGIEQTAVATNLEAAREIARQLRLRDMAGLVVIDFIDMEVGSNVRKVEKAMKDALKDDRARIQVGRISSFGLMEMSRQRLRTGVLEASTRECPHCEGTGLVRTASSAGLSALRLLEEEAARGKGTLIILRASQEAAFYVLNNKRREIDEIEQRYGVTISILSDGEVEGARMSVEASGPRPTQVVNYAPIVYEDENDIPEDMEEDAEEFEDVPESEAVGGGREPRRDGNREGGREERSGEGEGGRRRRRRRRRGRREDGDAPREAGEGEAPLSGEDADESELEAAPVGEAAEAGEEGRPRGRRGRRGGKRRRGAGGDAPAGDAVSGEEVAETAVDAHAEAQPQVAAAEDAEPAAKTRRRPRARKGDVVPAEAIAAEPATEAASEAEAEVATKPKRTRRKKGDAAEAAVEPVEAIEAAAAASAAPTSAEAEAEAPAKPKRAPRKKAAPKSAEPEAEASAQAAPASNADVAPSRALPSETIAQSASMSESISADADDESDENGAPRRGWWQRTFGN